MGTDEKADRVVGHRRPFDSAEKYPACGQEQRFVLLLEQDVRNTYVFVLVNPRLFYKKLKNVSCEHYHVNG